MGLYKYVMCFFTCFWCFLHVVECYQTTCKLAYIYGDHMVLQREPYGAVLWGYTNLGFSVNVTFKGINQVSKGVPGVFGSDVGVWRVVLPPQRAGGPFKIYITCFDELGNMSTIQLQDILFGDVWMCSGQSNMAMPVKKVINSAAELAASVNYPDVRVLSVRQKAFKRPLYDLKSTQSVYHEWAKASPESLGANAVPNEKYFSALCWFYGRDLYDTYKVPMGLISSNMGASTVEAWSSPDVIKACKTNAFDAAKVTITNSSCAAKHTTESEPIGIRYSLKRDTSLWNAMIHPFLNMTIKGTIWYQGEANSKDPGTYSCLFRAIISDWRSKWHEGSAMQTNPDFPFGFVQISTSWKPVLGEIGDYPIRNYPLIRWHQTNDVGYVPNARMPNVFMAVALDLADPESPSPIHPRYKQDVARRLVQAARAVAYQEKGLVYQGPFPTKFTVNSQRETIDIHYNNVGSGPIRLVGHFNDTFEVCCSNCSECQDGDPWICTAVIKHSDPNRHSLRIRYSCPGLHPVAIRYLWRDYACTFKMCTVYNEDGFLPAPPFWLPLDYSGISAIHIRKQNSALHTVNSAVKIEHLTRLNVLHFVCSVIFFYL